MKSTPLRIAITGPESTGKSSLAKELAAHYNTLFVEEYAREYIDQLGRQYSEDDILQIARGQLANEEEKAGRAHNLLFCDTELTVCQIWSLVKYNRCHPWISQTMAARPYPLYLLTNIDLPWEDDPQREHPHLREHLFQLYHENLSRRGVNFAVVSGQGTDRLLCAISQVENLLQSYR